MRASISRFLLILERVIIVRSAPIIKPVVPTKEEFKMKHQQKLDKAIQNLDNENFNPFEISEETKKIKKKKQKKSKKGMYDF